MHTSRGHSAAAHQNTRYSVVCAPILTQTKKLQRVSKLRRSLVKAGYRRAAPCQDRNPRYARGAVSLVFHRLLRRRLHTASRLTNSPAPCPAVCLGRARHPSLPHSPRPPCPAAASLREAAAHPSSGRQTLQPARASRVSRSAVQPPPPHCSSNSLLSAGTSRHFFFLLPFFPPPPETNCPVAIRVGQNQHHPPALQNRTKILAN